MSLRTLAISFSFIVAFIVYVLNTIEFSNQQSLAQYTPETINVTSYAPENKLLLLDYYPWSEDNMSTPYTIYLGITITTIVLCFLIFCCTCACARETKDFTKIAKIYFAIILCGYLATILILMVIDISGDKYMVTKAKDNNWYDIYSGSIWTKSINKNCRLHPCLSSIDNINIDLCDKSYKTLIYESTSGVLAMGKFWRRLCIKNNELHTHININKYMMWQRYSLISYLIVLLLLIGLYHIIMYPDLEYIQNCKSKSKYKCKCKRKINKPEIVICSE